MELEWDAGGLKSGAWNLSGMQAAWSPVHGTWVGCRRPEVRCMELEWDAGGLKSGAWNLSGMQAAWDQVHGVWSWWDLC